MEALVNRPSFSFGQKEKSDDASLESLKSGVHDMLDETNYTFTGRLRAPFSMNLIFGMHEVLDKPSPSSFCEENLHPTVDSDIDKFPCTSPPTSVIEFGETNVVVDEPSPSSLCKETLDPSLRGSTSVSSAVRNLPGSSLSSSVRKLCDGNLPIPSPSAGGTINQGICVDKLGLNAELLRPTMRETSLPVRLMSPALLSRLNHPYVFDCQPMDVDAAVGEEQRTNLFYGRAFVHGKLSTVVIDGGSCANMIGESLVNELGLRLFDHPRPYKLMGINGSEMLVSKRSRVSFTVQDYGDSLELDVVPTSVVHVLLGRPWLFDMRVKHDGYRNGYTFTKNKMTINLLPLTPIQVDQLLNEIKEAARGNG